MNISEHLKKDYWTRRVHKDSVRRLSSGSATSGYYRDTNNASGIAYLKLTQDDFLNEIQPSAHDINSEYNSKRPVYAPTGKKDPKTGKEEYALDHYDDVQSVALGLQLWLSLKKTTHFAGEGFWIANETEYSDLFDKLNSWKDIVGLNTAFIEAVDSCNQTGDAAIYLYHDSNTIDYEVFSYLKGDVLFPDIDEQGRQVLYRKYNFNGRDAVDIFTADERQTWVKMDDNNEEDKSWLDKFKKWIKSNSSDRIGSISEDGYKLIAISKAQTADGPQVVYFRVPDIPSGPAESAIEILEETCSFMAEEVKNDAFPVLFLKGGGIKNLPPSDANGKVIGVTGSADTIAHSDAKFLAPPDVSNIEDKTEMTLVKNILRSTSSVEITPEIFKSGADSSTSIKIMFAPEIQWCKREWIHYFKPVKQLVQIFIDLVGKVEQNPVEFSKLKVSVGQNIYIPQNEQEKEKMVLDKVYARVLSRKNAMTELESPYIGDYEQIMEEWKNELDIKSRIPATAKAEVDKEFGTTTNVTTVEEEPDPNEPDIDNRMSGKTIAE